MAMGGNGHWDASTAAMDPARVAALAARQWVAFGRECGQADAAILASAPRAAPELAELVSRDPAWCEAFVAAFPAALAEELARPPGAD
jgi:hypothetical protein